MTPEVRANLKVEAFRLASGIPETITTKQLIENAELIFDSIVEDEKSDSQSEN